MKSTKQSKLLYSSKNVIYDFNQNRLGFKINLNLRKNKKQAEAEVVSGSTLVKVKFLKFS